jgi:hypothetical protein
MVKRKFNLIKKEEKTQKGQNNETRKEKRIAKERKETEKSIEERHRR